MEKQISTQAAKFFQDLLSSDSEQQEVENPPQKKQILEPKAITDEERANIEVQQVIERQIVQQNEQVFLLQEPKELEEVEEVEEVKVHEPPVFEEPVIQANPPSVIQSELQQPLVPEKEQKQNGLVPNLFAEDDSLEINLDSVLFSNTALCLDNKIEDKPKVATAQLEQQIPFQSKPRKEQIKQQLYEHISQVQETTSRKAQEVEKPKQLKELRSKMRQYLSNPNFIDKLIQSLQEYEPLHDLEELKLYTLKILRQVKENPSLNLKQNSLRFLDRKMEMTKSEKRLPKRFEFASLAKQEQLQIPKRIENLPELLLYSLMGQSNSGQHVINDYIERAYSISDPFYVLVKIYLGREEEVVKHRELGDNFPVKFYLTYLDRMSSQLMKPKIHKFWNSFILHHSSSLSLFDIFILGVCLGFRNVDAEIQRWINAAEDPEKKQAIQCFYWLLNKDISLRERMKKLKGEEEQQPPRVRRNSQTDQIKRVEKYEYPQEISAQPKLEQQAQVKAIQQLPLKKQVPQQQEKQSGILGFFKKLVTTDEPVRKLEEIETPKPAKKAYYYDHDLKTWIINGKPADNEHDDNILGLDQIKKDANPMPNLGQEKLSLKIQPLSEDSPEQKKVKPPPKFIPEEKKAHEIGSSAPRPPPKLLPIPKPFEPSVVPAGQKKEVQGGPPPSQISNPFSFSQNAGSGKIQNSRIRNLGSRYATPF